MAHPNNLALSSRLNNTNSIQALLAADYKYVVGDNSRADLKPENPFWIFPTQVRWMRE
jgi:hypothetical protein